LVITGGTALLDGLEEVAEEIFDLPVRRGDPNYIGGLIDRVSTPDYATAVGLILYGYNQIQVRGFSRDKKKASGRKLKTGSMNKEENMRDESGSKIKFRLAEESSGAKIKVIGIGGGGGNGGQPDD